jgi:hypothetical protein
LITLPGLTLQFFCFCSQVAGIVGITSIPDSPVIL